jgi:hypothetical protein
VTRRSNVLDFFIAKNAGGDLVLRNQSLSRYLPYLAALALVIFFSIIILILYRIYSRRRMGKSWIGESWKD